MTVRRRYVDGPFGQIHLTETTGAAGDPPSRCLLIHQTPRSGDEFREVMDLIGHHHHLVAMDLPGMGSSDPPPAPARIEHYGAAAAAVIERLAGGPVTVCGHHTGGVVAIEVAASRPELVRGLVLSSTPWVDADARARRAERDPIDTVTRDVDGRHLSSLWEQRRPHYPAGHEMLDRFVADAMRATDPAVGHLAVGAYGMERAVTGIDHPVTVVEHASDPFASANTDDLVAALVEHGRGPVEVRRIPDGRVPLEATAPAFAEILDDVLTGT